MERGFRLLAWAWVGSLLTVGFIVAPTLFTSLDARSAGQVAAVLFRREAIIGVVCALPLLLLATRLLRAGHAQYRSLRFLVLAMLLCVLIGYFALAPYMTALRSAAEAQGLSMAESAYAQRFGALHLASTVFYGVQSCLGAVLVWRCSGRKAGR